MNTNRTKTYRRSASNHTDISGSAFAQHLATSTFNFVNFLNTEAESAYKRPWHRLERGLKLNRLRKFAEEEGERLHLSEGEVEQLHYQLLKAHNDKKILNSKTNVIYDQDEEKIKEIKGLVMHRGADGKVLFQILEKKNAVTFRRKNTNAQGQQGNQTQT